MEIQLKPNAQTEEVVAYNDPLLWEAYLDYDGNLSFTVFCSLWEEHLNQALQSGEIKLEDLP